MKSPQIIALRMAQQGLLDRLDNSPAAVVGRLGAVQAQDYQGAKWAVGQRCGAGDAQVEEAFNSGGILRTHVLRPTWHFVLPQDIRWMLLLTGPRVQRFNAFMYRKLGLTDRMLKRGDQVLMKALQGGRPLERTELAAALHKARLRTDDHRLGHFLMHAELGGLICSGPRQGRQFTYALLEERVPKAAELTRDEALARLVRRYFTTRGPATLQDFAWWSGLTVADGRRGVGIVGDALVRVEVNGMENWMHRAAVPRDVPRSKVHLLPNYDEYGIGYKDRSAFLDAARTPVLTGRDAPVHRHLIIVGGRMVGTWDHVLGAKQVAFKSSLFSPLARGTEAALRSAQRRYAAFLGLALHR